MSRSRIISGVLSLLLVGMLWIGFGPIQLGGSVSYVMVNGNSMEPGFQKGDLVLARKNHHPENGQAVVYENPQIGYVFHRIIDQEGEQYLLQGDNNDWVDTYQPTREEIIGKYWLRVPSGGTIISKLRQPLFFALFTVLITGGIAAVVFIQDGKQVAKKQRNRMKKQKTNSEGSGTDYRQDLLLFIGVIFLAALVLAIIGFLRPLEREVADDYQYQHQSELFYSADDASGIYDSTRIQTGEPIFLELTCLVNVELDYQFSAKRMTPGNQASFGGNYLIDAVVQDVDGWRRSVELVQPTSFQGTSFSSNTSLNACEIRDLILEKEEKTGTRNRWYTLSIIPEINYQGQISDLPLDGTAQPVFNFQMDATLLRLAEGGEQLLVLEEGALENTAIVPNSILILGQEIEIQTARWISLAVMGISLLISIWPMISLYQDWRGSDVSRIQVQYHPMLVDVKMGSPAKKAEQIVEVASFQDLSRMAERYGAMILHETQGSFHRYSIQDEQIVYQYSLDSKKGGSNFSDLVAFKQALQTAAAENQFELYYQPIVNVNQKRVVGIEAFLRWNHPQLGMIYPAEFISLAEENGLIPIIDQWVIQTGCSQMNEWKDFGLPLVPLSINLSPTTILDDKIERQIKRIIQESSCDPSFLQLEINRSNQIFSDQTIHQRLDDLRSLGVRLAIDNFATDAANQINQVSKIPIQSIKIDRSIMQNILEDQQNLRLIRAVVKLTQSLEIELVAQGIESEEQLTLLAEQNISLAQGYLLGEPIPAREMGWRLGKPINQNPSKPQDK